MIVGEFAIADGTAIADRFRKARPEWSGGDDVSRDGNERGCNLWQQRRELHIPAQHHMMSAQPRGRGNDALTHARRINGQCRSLFKDAGAGAFGGSGQAQCIVQRVDMEGLRKVDGMKVTLTMQYRAHAFDRPALDLAAKFADEANMPRKCVAIVGLGDAEPAILESDSRYGIVADCVANVFKSALRKIPEVLGPLKSDAADDVSGAAAKPGNTKPVLGAGAAAAIRPASMSATERPSRASSRATVKPARPPPITQISTSRSR